MFKSYSVLGYFKSCLRAHTTNLHVLAHAHALVHAQAHMNAYTHMPNYSNNNTQTLKLTLNCKDDFYSSQYSIVALLNSEICGNKLLPKRGNMFWACNPLGNRFCWVSRQISRGSSLDLIYVVALIRGHIEPSSGDCRCVRSLGNTILRFQYFLSFLNICWDNPSSSITIISDKTPSQIILYSWECLLSTFFAS